MGRILVMKGTKIRFLDDKNAKKSEKRANLGGSGSILEAFWIAIGGSWEDLGASRGCLEGVLGGVFEVLREFLVDIVFFDDFIMIFF